MYPDLVVWPTGHKQRVSKNPRILSRTYTRELILTIQKAHENPFIIYTHWLSHFTMKLQQGTPKRNQTIVDQISTRPLAQVGSTPYFRMQVIHYF